jgi:archaellum component FlaC
MTEYNLFCYSENYNDENSFQQKRYRVFNKEVGKKRYNEIITKVKEILKDLKLELDKNSWSEGWKKVTQEQWKRLLEIPEAKDFKKGFEYISGVANNLQKKSSHL